METTNYLYHYTNIEALALILKNKTIRFNPLNKMDDLQEQETADIKNIGQFCYVSSWTDEKNESIPMWNMYTSLTSGVRIGLRKNPFKKYTIIASDLSQSLNMPLATGKDTTFNAQPCLPLETYIPILDMIKNNFMSGDILSKNILHEVKYTDLKSKLYPKLYTPRSDGKSFEIQTGVLGIYKNLHWAFQKEWRYRFFATPFQLGTSPSASLDAFTITANKILHGNEQPPFLYYDMLIDDTHFSQMIITLSPQISAGNKVIIDALIKEYNPTATLMPSNLINLI